MFSNINTYQSNSNPLDSSLDHIKDGYIDSDQRGLLELKNGKKFKILLSNTEIKTLDQFSLKDWEKIAKKTVFKITGIAVLIFSSIYAISKSSIPLEAISNPQSLLTNNFSNPLNPLTCSTSGLRLYLLSPPLEHPSMTEASNIDHKLVNDSNPIFF